MSEFISIIVAGISVVAILVGYFLQKWREREFEIRQKRQEIYTCFIQNLVKSIELLETIMLNDPDLLKSMTAQDKDHVLKKIAEDYPNLDDLLIEAREIKALLALYGSDDAIKACSYYYKQGSAIWQPGSQTRADKDKMLLQLRRTLFPRTKVTSEDIMWMTGRR